MSKIENTEKIISRFKDEWQKWTPVVDDDAIDVAYYFGLDGLKKTMNYNNKEWAERDRWFDTYCYVHKEEDIYISVLDFGARYGTPNDFALMVESDFIPVGETWWVGNIENNPFLEAQKAFKKIKNDATVKSNQVDKTIVVPMLESNVGILGLAFAKNDNKGKPVRILNYKSDTDGDELIIGDSRILDNYEIILPSSEALDKIGFVLDLDSREPISERAEVLDYFRLIFNGDKEIEKAVQFYRDALCWVNFFEEKGIDKKNEKEYFLLEEALHRINHSHIINAPNWLIINDFWIIQSHINKILESLAIDNLLNYFGASSRS